MLKRIVFGFGMTAVVLTVFWLDHFLSQPAEDSSETMIASWRSAGLPILAVLGTLLVVGFFELNAMAREAGTRLLAPAGLLGVLLITALPSLTRMSFHPFRSDPQTWTRLLGSIFESPLLIVSLVVLGVFLNQMLTRRVEGALLRIASTLLAVTYLGLGGVMMFSIRVDYNLPMLLVFLGSVKLTDVGAYFVGSLLGKHKLIPWLSPGKSWEGLLGGVAMAAVTGVFTWWLAGQWSWFAYPLSCGASIVFCVIPGIVGQFGDLCESLLKRSAGVKDAGNLVPQFGGVLDILDSPLIAAPVAHVMLILLGAQ
ncbi:MAG: phosphatidate cytidylyltransferase [Phycisphaerae bacterium]|nr:phosphatidate cytidylyltransferase [Phycisphaerae bacterium]